MTDQKPTGVFMRFPVTDEQAQEMYRAYCAAYSRSSLTTRGIATQAALLAIGTPVTGRELTHIGTIVWFEKDREPSLASYCPALFKAGDSVRVTSLPIAQAQIAALEAEVVRLRDRYEAIRWRFIQDARIEGRMLTEKQFDTLVDDDDEAHKALKGGAA